MEKANKLACYFSAEPVSSLASVYKVTILSQKRTVFSQIFANFAPWTKSRGQVYARIKVVK